MRPVESTATPPLASEVRRSAEEKVEEAFEMSPFPNPMVVEVELPQVCGVKGKIAVSEEELILLLKSVQSLEAR